MHFACASFVVALHLLGPMPRACSLVPDPDDPRAARVLVGVPAPAAPAVRKLASSFRVSRNVDVSVSSLLKSLGGATYYRVAPGLALGAGSSVATLELPTGHPRALQLFTVLRFKF